MVTGAEHSIPWEKYVGWRNGLFYSKNGPKLSNKFRTADMDVLTARAEAEMAAREYERFKGLYPGKKMHVVRAALGDCLEVKRFLAELKEKFPEVYENSKFTLVDFSKLILSNARDKLKEHIDRGKVELREGDVQKLSKIVKDVFLFRASELLDDLPFCRIEGSSGLKVMRVIARGKDGKIVPPSELEKIDFKDLKFEEFWVPAGDEVKKWLEENRIRVESERKIPLGGLRLLNELKKVLVPGGVAVLHDYMLPLESIGKTKLPCSEWEENITHIVDADILKGRARKLGFKTKFLPQGEYYMETKTGNMLVIYPSHVMEDLGGIDSFLKKSGDVRGKYLKQKRAEMEEKSDALWEFVVLCQDNGHSMAVPLSFVNKFFRDKQEILRNTYLGQVLGGKYPIKPLEFWKVLKTYPHRDGLLPYDPKDRSVLHTLRLEKPF